MPFGSDQLRCSFVQKKDKTFDYVLSHLDGTIVDEIDIGQEDWPYNWPEGKKLFSWKFVDHTPDMRAKEQIRAAQTAYNSVEKVCGAVIDYHPEMQKTDLTIEWVENIDVFGGTLGVLAHAYLYFPNSSFNGVIEFNDSEASKWYFTPLGWPVAAYKVDPVNFFPGQRDSNGDLIMRGSQPMVEITMHEVGHSLVGRHDTIHPESMMFPFVKPGYVNGKLREQSFWWDDITSIPRLQEQFGLPARGFRMHWLNRWRYRRTLRHIYER